MGRNDISSFDAQAAAHQAHIDRQGGAAIYAEKVEAAKADAVATVFTGGTFPCLGWDHEAGRDIPSEWTLQDVYEWTSGFDDVDSTLYSLLTASTPAEAFSRLKTMRAAMVSTFLRFKEEDVEVQS